MNERIENEVVETENTNEEVVETQSDENESESTQENEGDENDTEDSETSEEDEGEKPKKKNGFKKRIDKLKRRTALAEEEAEYWKEKALKGKNRPSEKTETETKPRANGRPDPDDFDSQDEYLEAVTDWKVEQALAKKEAKSQEDAVSKKQAETAKAWKTRVDEFREKHDDFDDVMEDVEEGIRFSKTKSQAIFESDLGPAILYELAKNPGEAERISNLSDFAAIKEFGKIEARLQASSSTKTKTKTTTSAPDPITKTIKGGGKVTKDPDKMSQKEYEEWRNKQG